jgi:hypothetical protein
VKRALLILVGLAALAAAAWFAWQNLPAPGDGKRSDTTPETPISSVPGPGGPYLKGAHWFGEAWAVNFWNTRLLERAAEDFAALREDGFNTVVLVVPWPGFSPAMTDGSLVPQRAERLLALIDLAAEAELDVVLRVSYAWDASVPRSGRWLRQLWLDPGVHQAWIKHLGALWTLVQDRPNVLFGFLSWEDLWAVEGFGEAPPERRLELAYETGYQDWLARYSTLEAVSRRYGRPFQAWHEVPVPARLEPAFGLFFDFIDYAWIERFFKPAQAVFPPLSMEIRIDSDPVWNAPGDLAYWHSHELSWDLPGAPWTTVYWAPAMGGANEGETLTPEESAERLAYLMNRLRAVTGERPIFIDQFLVEDFTPGFEMNDRLPRDQVDEFLEKARPVLERLTHGYALWTWRDYAHNAVASPDFSSRQGNWVGAIDLELNDATYPLRAGERLQRGFGRHEFHAPGGPESAELCVEAVIDGDPAPDLRVYTDQLRLRAELDTSGEGRACIDIAVSPLTTVTLEAISDLELFNVSFAGFVQPTGIRDLEGQPKPIAEAWRALNRDLARADPAPFEFFDDGWMGKTVTRSFDRPRSQKAELEFRTFLPESWPFQPVLELRLDGETIATAPCADNMTHRFPLAGNTRSGKGSVQVALTADRTFRPRNDERRLGCLVTDLRVVNPD